MTATISVDRTSLRYVSDGRELRLSVEWSGVAKTADCPMDFEIYADDTMEWTIQLGEPIGAADRERILDEISEYYSKAPVADIIGSNGKVLRGRSTFRFCLHISPSPSLYHEVGRTLAIPMLTTKGSRVWEERYIANFAGITRWTEPPLHLTPDHLALIAQRIRNQQRIGIVGLPERSPAAEV